MRFLSVIVLTASIPLCCVANAHGHMHGHNKNTARIHRHGGPSAVIQHW
jgi:hypothetical protein